MAASTPPADGRRAHSNPHDGWPPVIRTKVFYGREEDHWFALDVDFDIASMGSTADEALASLTELVSSYLESCAQDGTPFEDARRPIPRVVRLRLHLRALASKILRRFVRSAEAREGELVLPPIAPAAC